MALFLLILQSEKFYFMLYNIIKLKSFFFTSIYASILLLVGCDGGNQEICYSNQQSVQTGFYSSYQLNDVDTTLSNVTLVGIKDESRLDSIISDNESVKKSFLPLSSFFDTTNYVVQVNNFTDTISFVHSKELSFISEECGFIYEFKIDTVLYSNTSFIDSVVVSYPSVIYNESKENVKIYIY